MKYHIEFDVDFLRNSYGGRYIVIEGIDGSGKTTQVEKLTEYFQKKGKKVLKTREPRKNQGIIGELIQKILHGKANVPAVAFQYLFSADRQMHHAEVIIPALKEGKIVVSDRCFWSAVPYGLLDARQEVEMSKAKRMLCAQSILSMYHQFIVPDETFYLDIGIDKALSRLEKSSAKKEIYEEGAKLVKIKEGYDWLTREFPKEFVVVDASADLADVTKEIIARLK